MSAKLVLWSGGCDSTIVLYEALRDFNVRHYQGKPCSSVRAISINYACVPCNREQRNARARIKAKLWENPGITFDHIEISITYDGFGPQRGTDGGAVQSQMWIATATPYLLDDEDLLISWIDGETDHNLPDAQVAFDALQRLNAKRGKLQLPLWRRYKTDVVDQLKKAELLDLCWYCEQTPSDDNVATLEANDPLTEPCGKCKKCIDHAAALWKLDHYPRAQLQVLGMVS